jgi:ribosomal protein L34E
MSNVTTRYHSRASNFILNELPENNLLQLNTRFAKKIETIHQCTTNFSLSPKITP